MNSEIEPSVVLSTGLDDPFFCDDQMPRPVDSIVMVPYSDTSLLELDLSLATGN